MSTPLKHAGLHRREHVALQYSKRTIVTFFHAREASVSTIDGSIGANLPRAVDLLARLVERPSVVGSEADALEVLASEWAVSGFAITRLPIPEDIGNHPAAGVPRHSYADRYDVVGQRGGQSPSWRSLVINGHIDVVPAEDAGAWSSPPFVPTIREGWLYGRGAGDMKSGFAAGLLALWALDEAEPGWLGDGALTLVAAIEEEYTGNGTLAAGRAGYLGDAALLLEPTDLALLLAGIGVIWVSIEVEGRSGHAEAATRSVNPVLGARPVLAALEMLERDLNARHDSGEGVDPVLAGIGHPYNVNIGTFHAGDWASSVPSTARIEVRVGYPRAWTSDHAYEVVRTAVLDASADDPWLAEHPPRLRLSGFRAQGYAQEPTGELIETLRQAHQDAHGRDPELLATGATTDARFYINQFGVPAVAYGPRTRNMHGADEAVEIVSIADTARTVARFLIDWFQARGASQ